MSEAFRNLKAINLEYAENLEKKLQKSFDILPRQNFVTADDLFYQDTERSARGVITWLHEKRVEREKFRQENTALFQSKLDKLHGLQRRRGGSLSSIHLNTQARPSDGFTLLGETNELADLEKEAVQSYALQLVEKVIDIHHAGREATQKMLQVLTELATQFETA